MIRKISALLLPLLFAMTYANAFCPVGGFWVPSAEVDGKIGSFRKGAGITLLAPVCQDDNSLVFWQTNFGNYRKVWTGSLGLGYRRLFSPCVAWGVNGFADVSYSEASRTYGQLGFGAELLGRCWEARFNGYVPTTRRTLVHEEIMGAEPFVQEGTQRFFSHLGNYRLFERSYKGFDAEAGCSLKFWRGQLWGYGGYYWFDDRGARPIEGPRVRLEYHLFNLCKTQGTRVVLGGEWAYDHLHRNQGLFYASLRIPLCGYKKGCALDIQACQTPTLCQRMNNRVIREPGIWIDRTREDEHYDAPLLGKLTGGARHLYFVSNDGDGGGSLENPLSLKGALDRAGPEDFLFLLGDFELEGTLGLQYGQTLLGSGSASEIPLDFVEYGIYTIGQEGSFLPRALLQGDGTNPVVSMAHHSVMRGINIDANGGKNAIVAFGSQNIRLSRGTISNTEGSGMVLHNVLNPTVYDFDLHNIGGDAVTITGTNAVIRKLDLDGIGGCGLKITSSDQILVEGLAATDLAGPAVLAEDSREVILRSIGAEEGSHTVSLRGVTHYAIHDSALSGSGDTTLALVDCKGRGFMKDVDLRSDGGTVLSIGDNASNLTFAGESALVAHGGVALEISKSGGVIDASALDINFLGSASVAPLTVSSAKEVVFGNVKGITQAPAAVELADSNVSFDNLIASNDQGTGLSARASSLTIKAGTIVAQGGPALDLQSVKGEMAIVGLTSIASGSHGIALKDFDGALHLREAKIIGASEGAILLEGGKANLAFHGQILNSTGPLLTVSDLDKAGSVSLYGQWIEERNERIRGLQGRGGQGVVLTRCQGPVNLAGLDIESVDSPAYLATDSIGNLVLNDSLLTAKGETETVVGVHNGADFTMKGCTVSAGEGGLTHGVRLSVDGSIPTITIPQEGEEDLIAAPTPQRFVLRDNTFHGAQTVRMVDASIQSAPGATQVFAVRNDTGSAHHPYSFRADGDGGHLAAIFRGNKGAREGEEPITVTFDQNGSVKASLSNRSHAMDDNPDLIGGHFDLRGRVDNLWEAPPLPKEELNITYVLGSWTNTAQPPAEN